MTSQINPNNIDGNYPVAGVPNNTQGMRDNFTNTKTNFQYAYDEITELQSKVVLKQALTGTTLDNNMNDSILYAVTLKDVGYSYVPVAATSGSVELDYSAGGFQQITPTGSISLSFVNWPASGIAGSLRVGINITNVSYTVTLPAAVSQGISTISGVSPGTPGVSNTITFGTVGNYAFEFDTVDGGVTIWVFDDSRPPGIIANPLSITNTTASTSTTTGALIVAGGVGVAGNLNIGTNLSITGTTSLTGNIAGNLNVTGNIAGGNVLIPGIVSATGNVISTGNILVADGGAVGYTTGAGGTVAQAANKTTGVTLNKPSGEITMQNTALAAATTASFTLTNSTIGARDLLLINIVGGATAGAYNVNANCTSGSAVISVTNRTAGSLSEAIVLRYAVIRGSIS